MNDRNLQHFPPEIADTRVAKPDWEGPDWSNCSTQQIDLPCDGGWEAAEATAPAPLLGIPPPHLTPKQRLKYISLVEAFRAVYRKIVHSEPA